MSLVARQISSPDSVLFTSFGASFGTRGNHLVVPVGGSASSTASVLVFRDALDALDRGPANAFPSATTDASYV